MHLEVKDDDDDVGLEEKSRPEAVSDQYWCLTQPSSPPPRVWQSGAINNVAMTPPMPCFSLYPSPLTPSLQTHPFADTTLLRRIMFWANVFRFFERENIFWWVFFFSFLNSVRHLMSVFCWPECAACLYRFLPCSQIHHTARTWLSDRLTTESLADFSLLAPKSNPDWNLRLLHHLNYKKEEEEFLVFYQSSLGAVIKRVASVNYTLNPKRIKLSLLYLLNTHGERL